MRSTNTRILVVALLGLSLAFPALAGKVSGTVKFDGEAPKLKPVDMNADPGCGKKHSTPMANEMLVLGAGNTLGNVFVRVKSGLAKKDYPAPTQPVVLDQDGCRYVPHVLGLLKGQTLKILNSDGLLHNVHALPTTNKTFNMAMPATRKEAEVTFTEEEFIFKVKCDVHPWMGAYIAVMSHPYFDVTATDGKFEIANLPPGTYEIEAWHEKLATKTSSVTISGEETKAVDFSFAPPPAR